MGTPDRRGRPGAPDVIAVYDLDGGRLRARQGTKPTPDDDIPLARRSAGAVRAAATGEPFFDPDIRSRPGIAPGRFERRGVISACWLPLGGRGEVIAVIGLGWLHPVHPPALGQWDPASLLAAQRLDGGAKSARADSGALDDLALIDPLTGFPNKTAWLEQLDRDLARSSRDGSSLCVALVDLDDFCNFNAKHGTKAGDSLLRNLAEEWRLRMRLSDFGARVGPDELGLILPACDPGDATALVDRLREASPQLTCSAAIAAWDGGEDTASLLRRLDDALYRAKQTGRNRTEVAAGAASAGASWQS